MALVEIVGANETLDVVQAPRVITYLHVLQDLNLRCGWSPPALPNVKTSILDFLAHEITFLEFDAEMAFLTDSEKLL